MKQAGNIRGVALIEALVGMTIFAFGVLGLIGLQASMSKAQTASKHRASAAVLASELFGLIQSDAVNQLGNYDSSRCDDKPACADWQRRVSAQLPGGDSTVDVELATGLVTLTITWQQGREPGHQYQTTMTWR